MTVMTRFTKPFVGLWRQPEAPQAPPRPKAPTTIPSLIHHEGIDYKVLPLETFNAFQTQIERLKKLQWAFPDRLWLCCGVGVACFAGGYAISQSSKPPVQIVDRPVPVEKTVIVDRPVPIDRNCFAFCKD